jgi:hypothetical protein
MEYNELGTCEEDRDMLEVSMVLDLPTDQLIALGFEPKQMIADIRESMEKSDLLRNSSHYSGGDFIRTTYFFKEN